MSLDIFIPTTQNPRGFCNFCLEQTSFNPEDSIGLEWDYPIILAGIGRNGNTKDQIPPNKKITRFKCNNCNSYSVVLEHKEYTKESSKIKQKSKPSFCMRFLKGEILEHIDHKILLYPERCSILEYYLNETISTNFDQTSLHESISYFILGNYATSGNYLRKNLEYIVNEQIKKQGLTLKGNAKLFDKIDAIFPNSTSNDVIKNTMHTIRGIGNESSHQTQNPPNKDTVLNSIKASIVLIKIFYPNDLNEELSLILKELKSP